MFNGTRIKITIDGRRQLGAVIGNDKFKCEYVSSVVDEWVNQVNRLSEIAKIEPHAEYSSFTHGLKHRYTFIMRTMPSIDKHLQRLDDAINNFITILLRGHHFTELERDLFALPAKRCGLGIIIP